MGFVADNEPPHKSREMAPGNSLNTVRGPVGSFHLWIFVSFVIVVIAIALMLPQLRGEIFGAAVSLYNSVVPTL